MEVHAEAGALPRRRPDRALAALLALAALWYGWFIFRTSFVIDGERVFCLFDDAMISMTYARNVLEGYGLTWGRTGEPVEGFTHPLWTALMVAANALPIPLRFKSLPMQVLSAALLLANVVLVRRLVLRHFTWGQARTWLPAAVLTAFYYPLVYWSLMGMETALQAVIATASALLALDAVGAVENGRGRHVALWLLAAAAYLLRMDMLLMVVVVQAFVLTQGGLRRKERGRWLRWLLGLGIFAGAVLGYGLFRWLYFGDVLPNTYYLKLSGIPVTVRLLRGLEYLGDFARAHAALLIPVGLGVALLMARGSRRDRRRFGLPAALFLVQCAYSVWVGGDAWEMDINVRANRFIAFAMPMVFVMGNGLLNISLAALADRRKDQPAQAPGAAGPRDLLPTYLAAGTTAAALLFANGVWGSERNQENLRNLLVTGRPLHIVSHQVVYTQLKALQKIAAPGAVVAAFWAGIPAYFSDFHNVDLLGYNDRRIAHSEAKVKLTEDNFRIFQPGHMKWDTDYVLAERRPDAFLQLWGIDRPGRKLPRLGYVKIDGFWVRRKSPKIRRFRPEDKAQAPPASPSHRPAPPQGSSKKPPPPISSI